MTLKQMEKVLMDNVPAKFGRDEIRAALKAGQALRHKAKEAIKELEDGYETCGLIVDMKQLVKDWDTATKGDV